MTGRRRLGMVAAIATLLASAPLSAIFDTWTWLLQTTLVVLMIAGSAVATRSLRFPTWAQAIGMVVALLVTLTWIYPNGGEVLIPTPGTLAHFADLVQQAGEDTRSYGVPVPDRDGLLFVAVLGIGLVAIVVDLLTAVFRRPALAGLPMLAIYSIPVAVYLDSVPVAPFIIAAVGYLWLLVADNVDRVRRFGRRFTGDGRDVDVWEPSPLAAAGRRLGVAGVVVAVLLPLAVPTVSGGLLSRITQSGTGVGNGLGSGGGRINLFASLSGQLQQTNTVNLLKVTTNEPDPFYLRFGVADTLTDAGFSNQSPTGSALSRGSLPDPQADQSTNQASSFDRYHAEIEVTDGLRQNIAPIYSYLVGINGITGSWAYDSSQQVLFSGRSTTSEQKYSIDYLRPKYTASQLRNAPTLAENDLIRQNFTKVPPDEAVDGKVQKLIKGKDNDYDRVRAIYDSFSRDNGFTYSLTTQAAGNASDIAAFLEKKEGYCQQYAAAMAWMVRAAGIPARVAFGFTRGTPEDTDTYVITNRNAHAWTEVYFQGFGWVPFDATPAANVSGSARSAWAPDTDSPEPAASASTGAAAPGATSSAAAGAADRPDRSNDGTDSGTSDALTPAAGSSNALPIAVLVTLLVALLLVPAVRRILLRRRRHAVTTGPPPVQATVEGTGDTITDIVVTTEEGRARADAHAAWDELIDTMIDFRVPVDPTETPRHTAQRLIRDAVLTGDPAEAATLLGTAEERARYARQPLQGAELTTALTRLRSGISHSATPRARFRATFLPPSVFLSWRLALSEASTRTVEAASRLRDHTTRFSPRRLLKSSR
ncbi:DUF3488 and transglutaminase-like domain-containing protein [Actinoplanes sp. NPDC051851]|uniref:transglutaminase TgpA family protein n=1 Tax=Actinoplanes sp. NPDC051851 TaxID=3154753 RepID=UPI003439C550